MQTTATISSVSMSSQVSVSAASDTGMVRSVNEDSYLAAGPIFLVADGMGGHNAGDQASQSVRATFERSFPDNEPATTASVLAAIKESNIAVRAISSEGSASSISGTTLAGVALVANAMGGLLHWMAFNIGDSRIYSWDGRSLVQLSVDHSAVQELVEAGVISDEEAALHPDRNIITRAIGASDHVDADVWILPASRHQTFLMCSDGLTKELDDAQIARLLAEHPDSSEGPSLAEALVEAALAAGGRDNVTVVVVESHTSGSELDVEETRDRDSLESIEDTRPRS